MEASNGIPLMGAAMFGFLAVAAIAVFSFISVAHWISTRQQERETKERFALMKLLLEHPGEEGIRVMNAWREQEAWRTSRSRRLRHHGARLLRPLDGRRVAPMTRAVDVAALT